VEEAEQSHEPDFEGARGKLVALPVSFVAAPLQSRLCGSFGFIAKGCGDKADGNI